MLSKSIDRITIVFHMPIQCMHAKATWTIYWWLCENTIASSSFSSRKPPAANCRSLTSCLLTGSFRNDSCRIWPIMCETRLILCRYIVQKMSDPFLALRQPASHLSKHLLATVGRRGQLFDLTCLPSGEIPSSSSTASFAHNRCSPRLPTLDSILVGAFQSEEL